LVSEVFLYQSSIQNFKYTVDRISNAEVWTWNSNPESDYNLTQSYKRFANAAT